MSQPHIPLKLTAAEAEPSSGCAYLIANDKGALARVLDYRLEGLAHPRARRLAAAWNLVEGIPTEDFEGKELADYVSSQAFLAHAGPTDEGFNVQVKGLAAQMLASCFAGQLVGSGAPNYIEFHMHHPETGGMVVTLQREAGKTPHQLRAAAESEVARLRAALQDIAAHADPHGLRAKKALENAS